MKIQSKVKAGRVTANHNQRGSVVKSSLKAGRISTNHNQPGKIL
jgi:hypothetical protein